MNFGGGGGGSGGFGLGGGGGRSLVETIIVQLIARGVVFALKNKPTICINDLPPVLNGGGGTTTSSTSGRLHAGNKGLSNAKTKTNYIFKKKAIALLAGALNDVIEGLASSLLKS
jgi:hypothetical protein